MYPYKRLAPHHGVEGYTRSIWASGIVPGFTSYTESRDPKWFWRTQPKWQVVAGALLFQAFQSSPSLTLGILNIWPHCSGWLALIIAVIVYKRYIDLNWYQDGHPILLALGAMLRSCLASSTADRGEVRSA